MSDATDGPGPGSARLTVFCEPNVREVFEAVVAPTQMWQADPYDVDDIHREARDAFGRLVARASASPPPDRGRVLLLRGDAGSGKTHLMRAFRTASHADRSAYFCYLQLTTAAQHYGQYMLANVIASLEHPYAPPSEQRTGLQRLSTALLDAVPGLSGDDCEAICNGDAADGPNAVFGAAERLLAHPRFIGRDEDLIRALLFLQRDEPRVRSKVLKWLRGEDLNAYDRSLLGDLQPRPQPERAVPQIVELGRLMASVEPPAALVLCVDQLEDVFNQAESDERFRLIADVLVTFSETLPTGIVVVSCLSDYYTKYRQTLPRSRLDRIEHDPEPVDLHAERSADEVSAIVACRLAELYREAGLVGEAGSTFPFRPEHLAPLANLNTRKVLDICRRHHERCVVAGGWVEPAADSPPATVVTTVVPAGSVNLDQLWNDAVNGHVAVPDGDADRVALLARAIAACNGELPEPYRLSAVVDNAWVAVEERGVGDAPVRLLVALCDKSARGGALGRQVEAAGAAADGRAVVLVRSTPFDYGPGTQVARQVGGVLKATGGRKVEAVDADWRAMAAFERFATDHVGAALAAWQRTARPLSRLRTLQEALDLGALAEPRVAVPVPTATPTVPAAPPVQRQVTSQGTDSTAGVDLNLGRARRAVPEPVVIQPDELKQHMVFVGGNGSGKTTAALRLIEQLLERGTPAVLIDRKGDLARYADPAAWDVPDSPDRPAHGPRRRGLRGRLDVDLFTPGSGPDRGRPLALPVFPDDLSAAAATDRGEQARFAADALGSMMGLAGKSAADATLLAILSKAIEVMAESVPAGQPIGLEAVRGLIASQDETLLNAVGGFDAKHYKKLAERMLAMQINHGPLLSGDGERLDVDRLFARQPNGRARLTVINTGSLTSAEAVQFWLSRFLVTVDRWRARHPSPTLQAVLFMDEADQYLPATSKPPTKGPLESLLKRGRSAGLGVMLATQSPGDLDYKGRDNLRAWLVGRVQEPVGIAKLKPLFAGSAIDVAARLPQQSPGEFYLLREGKVTSVKAGRSLVETRQVPEEQILRLARERRSIA
jgi:RecA/RadA recombinase